MYVFISFFIVKKLRFYNEIVNLIILKLEESLVIILYVFFFFLVKLFKYRNVINDFMMYVIFYKKN